MNPHTTRTAAWKSIPLYETEMRTVPLVQGVGMILPIEASMHTPAHFDGVLAGTMAAVTALYVGFGSVGISHPFEPQNRCNPSRKPHGVSGCLVCVRMSMQGFPAEYSGRNAYAASQHFAAVAAGGLHGVWGGDP